MEKLQREITQEKEQLLQLRYSCDQVEDTESKQKFTLLIVSPFFLQQQQKNIVFFDNSIHLGTLKKLHVSRNHLTRKRLKRTTEKVQPS